VYLFIMLSYLSRFRKKLYPPLYPPQLYPPQLYSPLFSPYKHNLQDYIRKIESDIKNKHIGYNHIKVDNNYGILSIVGILYLFYTFGKRLLLSKIE
jgi:hypothetical protein